MPEPRSITTAVVARAHQVGSSGPPPGAGRARCPRPPAPARGGVRSRSCRSPAHRRPCYTAWMARLVRLMIGIALVALIAVGLAACGGGGGGGGGGEDKAEGLTPAAAARPELHRGAGARPPSASTSTAIGQIDLPAGDGPAASAACSRARSTSPARARCSRPTRPRSTLKLGLSGLPAAGQRHARRRRGVPRLPGPGLPGRPAPEQVALLDLGSLYPTLVDWATNPVAAGTEEIDGTSTVKVDAGLDPAAALTALAPALGVTGVDAGQGGRGAAHRAASRRGSAPRTCCPRPRPRGAGRRRRRTPAGPGRHQPRPDR